MLTLTLAMEYEDILDEARFKREVESDVAVSLGPRATDVKVVSLGPGSVIVHLDAIPLGGLSPAEVLLACRASAVRRPDMTCVLHACHHTLAVCVMPVRVLTSAHGSCGADVSVDWRPV